MNKQKRLNKKIGNKSKIRQIKIYKRSIGWISSKKCWASISSGFVYLYWEDCRAYWILCNIEPKKRPKIKCADNTLTIHIATYKIKFDKQKDYDFAKLCLKNFIKTS
jgi:hypothetical protein